VRVEKIKLSKREQIQLMMEVRERAKAGNVNLKPKHIKKARKMIQMNAVNKSFPIYRVILGMSK
jgi:hypothetical protein